MRTLTEMSYDLRIFILKCLIKLLRAKVHIAKNPKKHQRRKKRENEVS